MQAGWIERAAKPGAAFLLLALLLAASCKVDQDANEHRSCHTNKDCPEPNTECYRGFCVAKESAGSSGTGGKGGGKQDGGVGPGSDGGMDAGMTDGGEGDAEVDASVAVPDEQIGIACSLDAGEMELCYLGKDQSTATKGVCRAGQRVCDCVGGARKCDQHVWGECFNQILPSAELCDGDDNDCNGKVDDDVAVGLSCVVDGAKGVCAEGVDSCDHGVTLCNQTGQPNAEICDGLDNDCDDKIDEDTDRPCYPDGAEGCTQDPISGAFTCKGLCKSGIQVCDKMKHEYGACGGPDLVTPDPENCNIGGPAVNEDCDDKTDEGCACDNGMMYDCYDGTTGPNGTLGRGPCTSGKQLCTSNELGSCDGQVLPHDETCANDGVDDDCNGSDDDVPNRDTVCHNFSKKGLCRDGTFTCDSGALKCVTTDPVDEICDGLDNDCSGVTDNGFDLQTDPLNCGECGRKCSGGTVCCAGDCVDTQENANHCGSCGHRCSAGGICCSGACKNSNSDAHHCRTCTNDCTLLGLLGACCSGTCSLGCGG